MKRLTTIVMVLILSIGGALCKDMNVVDILYNNNNVYTISLCGVCKYSMNGTRLTVLGGDTTIKFTKGRIAISNDSKYLYVADDSLLVYDVSNDNPNLLKRMIVEGLATDAKIKGDYLIISSPNLNGKDGFGNDTYGGINIFDLALPENPVLLSQGKSTLTDKCNHIAKIDIYGNYVFGFTSVYYGCGNPRLYIWDINNINSPINIGFTEGNLTQSEVIDIKAKDVNWAFVLQSNGDITPCSVENKNNPTWINKISVTRSIPPTSICLISNMAYSSHNDGIDVFDLSDPANGPKRDQDFYFKSSNIDFSAMTYTGDYFIVASTNKLFTFDANLLKVDSTQCDSCTVDINEIPNDNLLTFDIKPNPADDIFSISLNWNQIGLIKISLINSLGQLLYTTNAEVYGNKEIKINAQSYPAGVYWVQVKDENSFIQNKQIIIIK